MEKRRVVITGLGTVNPLGNNVSASWDAAMAASQLAETLLPSGFTVPRPVITTLRFSMRVFSFYIAMPPSAQSTCPVR